MFAFEQSLAQKFSAQAYHFLLESYVRELRPSHALYVASKLALYRENMYEDQNVGAWMVIGTLLCRSPLV